MKDLENGKTIILGIETSCDETSVALVQNGEKILSQRLFSQETIHGRFGGVVPELASRRHLEVIDPLVEDVLTEAGLHFRELDAVAVTVGPGLIGALLVGVSYAKALAYTLNIPLIGVNHLEGHLLSPLFENREISFPVVALIVSGGHTSLVFVKERGDYTLLGKTRDDAAGEALDKGARMLGLGYPGGPILDKMASAGGIPNIEFPRAYLSPDSLDFSFSGLKTALREFLATTDFSEEPFETRLPDVASSFQQAVMDVLIQKTLMAAKRFNVSGIVVGGGVAANSVLRMQLTEEANRRGISTYFPSPLLCTDNGAMVGAVGYFYYRKGLYASLFLNPSASLSFGQ